MSVKCIHIQKCGGNRWGILPRANQRSTGALVAAAPPPCSNPCYQRKSTPLGCFSCQSGKDAGLKACGIRRGILPRAIKLSTGQFDAFASEGRPVRIPVTKEKAPRWGAFCVGQGETPARGLAVFGRGFSRGLTNAPPEHWLRLRRRPVRIPVTKEKAPRWGAFSLVTRTGFEPMLPP